MAPVPTAKLRISIRAQDKAIWDRASEVAQAEYLPFSRFLTKVLAEYLGRLDQRRPDGQETS